MGIVLLTGGAGFIGSYLAKELIEKGKKVVIYDSFSSFASPFDSHYNRYLNERFKGIGKGVEIVRGDIVNASLFRKTLRDYKPERVIHLAALAVADIVTKFPEVAIESNLNGLTNVLEAVREVNFVRRFVFISSSFVYGDFKYVPADENHPTEPKEVYGGMKLAGEILTKAYSRRFGLEYTIIRPSAVYGPLDTNMRVTQLFIENAFKNKPIILHDNGNAKLDFTHVRDTARGIALAAYSAKGKNEIFNITRGQARSLKELADIISRSIPGVKIIKRPATLYRPKRGQLDISNARKLLNFKPRISLEEGMGDYIEWMKKNIQL